MFCQGFCIWDTPWNCNQIVICIDDFVCQECITKKADPVSSFNDWLVLE